MLSFINTIASLIFIDLLSNFADAHDREQYLGKEQEVQRLLNIF